MTVLSEVKNENKWVFEIEVSSDLITNFITTKQAHIRSKTVVAGFRKGKAPESILKSQLGEYYGVQEAIENAVDITCRNVVRDRQLNVVGSPVITKIGEYKPSESLALTLELEVFPEVEVGPYKGLTYTASLEPITDERVSDALATLREQFATLELVQTPIQLQDIAVVSMASQIENGPMIEAWTNTNGGVRVGSGLFGDDFDQALVGKVAGDSFELVTTFADDFPFVDVAGKTVVITGSVTEVRSRVVPDRISDAILSELKVATEEQLTQNCREFLEQQAKKDFNNSRFEQLMDQIVSAMTTNVSDTLVNMELDAMVGAEEENCRKHNTTFSDALAKSNQTIATWRESARDTALLRVKAGLAYAKIAELEGIQATEEEVKAFIRKQDPKLSDLHIQKIMQTPKMNDIFMYIVREKVVSLIVDSSVQVSESSPESVAG